MFMVSCLQHQQTRRLHAREHKNTLMGQIFQFIPIELGENQSE